MDSVVERQAVRAAIALAAASSHGTTPEIVADLRDEASQLIGFCVRSAASPDVVRAWCDDVASMLARLGQGDALPRAQLLTASEAVLRLRLSAMRAHVEVQARQVAKKSRPSPARRTGSAPKHITPVGANQKKVLTFVAEHPDVRTKDLLAGMADALSARSVKRYLKELSASGAIRRSEHPDGGVSYTAAE